MHIDYLVLIIIGIIGMAGGLYLLNEAKKYRARHRKDDSVPPNERWLLVPTLKEKPDHANEWMHNNPAADTDLDELEAKVETRKILLKHSFCDGRDCELEWSADFAKMEIILRVPFISPALLLNFLPMLPDYDERFRKTGITGVMNIASSFKIKLCVSHGQEGVWYSCRIYKFGIPDTKSERLEIELSGLPLSEDTIILTRRESLRLLELIENPPPRNEKFKKAMADHQKANRDGMVSFVNWKPKAKGNLLDVTAVKADSDFKLHLEFENGEKKIFDARPYLEKGIFRQLMDKSKFMQAYVDYGTVCWPGNLDISPETLYDRSEPDRE